MSGTQTSANSYNLITESLVMHLSETFSEWDVAIGFGTLEDMKQLPLEDGIVRITPIGWEHMTALKSPVGNGILLHYAIYVGIPLTGGGWTNVGPVSQAPLKIYDALRRIKVPAQPNIRLADVTDKVFIDFPKAANGEAFHSMLTVSFLAGDGVGQG